MSDWQNSISTVRILHGDCIARMADLPDASVQTCVTSPPYFGLRDYGVDGQIGLEESPEQYVAKMVDVFREVWRVLREDGTLWLNLGDSYAATTRSSGASLKSTLATKPTAAKTAAQRERGSWRTGTGDAKPKDLLGIPWRVAFALQADGWYLRQDIIWHKPNPMPESVRDRCTKAHEYLFLLAKSERYYFDAGAVKEKAVQGPHVRKRSSNFKGVGSLGEFGRHTSGGAEEIVCDGTRNRRSVWTITPKPYKGAHFATFPPELVEPCILAGSRPGDTVLDPFGGSGTTGMVANKHGRNAVLCELNASYIDLAKQRIEPEAIAA